MNITELCAFAETLGCTVKNNEPLSEHTTFRVGGCCDVFIEISCVRALAGLVKALKAEGIRFFVLGNGSNVLFDDRGYKGVVLHVGRMMSGIALVGEDRIIAEAGAGLSRLCAFACHYSLTGLEFANGIPGLVGGAVFMNAGAYGGEIKDVTGRVEAVTAEGGLITVPPEELDMSYRHSVFMDKGCCITAAEFRLTKGDPAEICAKMKDLMGRRREKQPLEYPSAGSTFKRPEGKYAGKLIQDSGLRGCTVGGAQVSEKHCGFVINKGGASSQDILTLIKHIQDTVLEKTGTELECEVRYIPYE